MMNISDAEWEEHIKRRTLEQLKEIEEKNKAEDAKGEHTYKKKLKTKMVMVVIGKCPFNTGIDAPDELDYATECKKCEFNKEGTCTWKNYETTVVSEKAGSYGYEHKFPCYTCGKTVKHLDSSISFHGLYNQHPTFKCTCGMKHKLLIERYSHKSFTPNISVFAIQIGAKKFIPKPIKVITPKEKIEKHQENAVKNRGAALEFK